MVERDGFPPLGLHWGGPRESAGTPHLHLTLSMNNCTRSFAIVPTPQPDARVFVEVVPDYRVVRRGGDGGGDTQGAVRSARHWGASESAEIWDGYR